MQEGQLLLCDSFTLVNRQQITLQDIHPGYFCEYVDSQIKYLEIMYVLCR